MPVPNKTLADILLKEQYVSADDIKAAIERTEHTDGSLADDLLSAGIITKDLLGQAIAEHYGITYADLNTDLPPKEQILRIQEEMATKHRVVLFKLSKDSATIATDEPETVGAVIPELIKLLGIQNVTTAYSVTEDIDSAFVAYRATLETRFAKIAKEQKRIAPELVDEIIRNALAFRASDVHLEPQDEELVIRFRVDGLLHEAGRLEKRFYENILNRVKVLAHLRTDEHMRTQDGAIRFKHDSHEVDLRVSIAPTLDGEKVVIRVLSEYVRNFTLSDLGLSQADQDTLISNTKKPFGMILAVGPTGSGKTTTMYGILKLLNKSEVNIATIEDPVEYKIAGVNHMQVNEQSDVTFARGLRAIVRQDPNIILVGEIRDKETAEIAVNAALTGHLLISTFHSNDASTAVPRLLDMGIESFLLASTLELIVAQRLVRRLCDNCRYSTTTTLEQMRKSIPDAEKYFAGKRITLYKAKGCASCNHTGYRGRLALFEIIRVTSELQDIITKKPTARAIWELAASQGSHSLFEDGMTKVQNGSTSLEEVMRVVPAERT